MVALSAGSFGHVDKLGIRAACALAFEERQWSHPIDRVVAHVDFTNRTALRVVETDVVHVPQESGVPRPAVRGPEGTEFIVITQPDGVSFTLDEGRTLPSGRPTAASRERLLHPGTRCVRDEEPLGHGTR